MRIIRYVAIVRETTYDTLPIPPWRTYETVGADVMYEDGSTAYLTNDELKRRTE